MLGHAGGLDDGALAVVRSGGGQGRRGRRAGAGQRQGAGAPHRAGRARRTTSCGSWRWPTRRSAHHTDGKTIRKVVVAQGPAGQRGGAMKTRGRAGRCWLVAALSSPPRVGGNGCGYSLAGRGSFLPVDIKTIGVPNFVNRTTVFNLETQLTQKVRSEFIGRGQYQILPEATGVDALLTGEVTRRDRSRRRASPTQQLASRYVDHHDRARRAARHAREQGAVGEPER